jgi:hypothetical protein
MASRDGATSSWTTSGLPAYTTPGVDWDCDGLIESGPVAANVNGLGSNRLWYGGSVGASNDVLDARDDRRGLPHNPGSACSIITDTSAQTAAALPATYRNAIGATDCLISSATTPTYAGLTAAGAEVWAPAAAPPVAPAVRGASAGPPVVQPHTDVEPEGARLTPELCNGKDDDGDMLLDEDCPDSDGDAVVDELDNCPQTPNQDQADADGDYLGDACGSPAVHHLSATASGAGIRLVATADTLDVRGYNVYRLCRGDTDPLRLGGYPTSEKPDYTALAPGELPCTYTMIAVNLNGQESGSGATASTGRTAVYLPLVIR